MHLARGKFCLQLLFFELSFYCWLLRFFIYSDVNPLSDMCILNIFFLVCDLFIYLTNGVFWLTLFVKSGKILFISVLLLIRAFCVLSRKSLPTARFKDSPNPLLVALWLWVMLRSMIHFGLIFVCRVWSETVLPFVKKTCFPHCFGAWSEIRPLGLSLPCMFCSVAGFAHLYASAILSWFLKLYSSWWFSTRDTFNVLGTCGYIGNNFDCHSGCEGWRGAPDI